MEKLNAFGNIEMLVEDINDLQSYKETAILNRTIDVNQEGIIKTSAVEPFALSNNTGAGLLKISIGAGVAYNPLGQRIEIMAGELVLADPQTGTHPNYLWLNSANVSDSQTPVAFPTPYSTGNDKIALVGASVVNYIFIDYIDTLVDIATAWGDWSTIATTKKYTLDQENVNTTTGTTLLQYPYIKPGYRIIIALAANVNLTTYKLNNFSNAIYLGSVVGNGATAPTIDASSYLNRKYAQQYPKTVKVDTPSADGITIPKTATYTDSGSYNLDDHIKCRGGATAITPANPHGQTIYDFGYTGADLSTHRYEQHTAMISASRSSAYALKPTVVGNVLTIQYLDPTLSPSTAVESVVSGGNRLVNTDIVTANGAGTSKTFTFIAQAAGTYYWYLDASGVITQSQANVPPATASDFFIIAQAYWNLSTTTLSVDILVTGASVGCVDRRIFGSISSTDISTGSSYQGESLTPVGAIVQFLAIPSTGWLSLNGSTVSLDPTSGSTFIGDQYYSLIKYLYGLGLSGCTAIKATLPNMTDKFSRGAGTTPAGTAVAASTHYHGSATGLYDVTHTHRLTDFGSTKYHYDGNKVTGYCNIYGDYRATYSDATPGNSGTTPTTTVTGAPITGTTNHQHTIIGDNDIVPAHVGLYYCIKY